MWKGYNFGNNYYSYSNVTYSLSNKTLDKKEKHHNSNEMVPFFTQNNINNTEQR